MKPLLTALGLALLLLLSAPAFSAYIIHLHDGTQFVTDQYFEDGDQIKFKRYGGLIGIEKERIRGIEKTELGDKVEKGDQAVGEDLQEPLPDRQGKDPGRENKQVSEDRFREQEDQGNEKDETEVKSIEVAKYTKEKRILLEKRRLSLRKYRIAREAGDEIGKAQAKKEYKAINNQLSKLAANLRKKNEGLLPSWWSQIKLEENSKAQP